MYKILSSSFKLIFGATSHLLLSSGYLALAISLALQQNSYANEPSKTDTDVPIVPADSQAKPPNTNIPSSVTPTDTSQPDVPNPPTTQSQPSSPDFTIHQLSGQWQEISSKSQESLIMVFAPEGKLFLIVQSSQLSYIQEARYTVSSSQINNPSMPKQLTQQYPIPIIIELNKGSQLSTIFDFPAQDRLRIQLQPENKTFVGSTLFKKVSSSTDLPPNLPKISF